MDSYTLTVTSLPVRLAATRRVLDVERHGTAVRRVVTISLVYCKRRTNLKGQGRYLAQSKALVEMRKGAFSGARKRRKTKLRGL